MSGRAPVGIVWIGALTAAVLSGAAVGAFLGTWWIVGAFAAMGSGLVVLLLPPLKLVKRRDPPPPLSDERDSGHPLDSNNEL